MKLRYSRRDAQTPAAATAVMFLVGLAAFAALVRYNSPGTWNRFWDKDERKIMPPQYLIQIPSGYALGGEFKAVWHDNKKAKDYSDYWRMVEDNDAPLTDVTVYAPGQKGPVSMPIRKKGGPFYTYKDVRCAIRNHDVKQVKLYNSDVIIHAELPTEQELRK